MNNMISRISQLTIVALALIMTSCSQVELPDNYFESPIPSDKQTQSESLIFKDFRDYRYCELLFSFADGTDTITEVYATMGVNECPSEEWMSINAENLRDTFGATTVKANGPRFWLVNKMRSGEGAVGYDKIATFGDLQMSLSAQIDKAVEETTYEEHIIKRWTTFKFEKNNRIYKLINPAGEAYIMQSYTTMVNPDLSIDNLENLAQVLDLPDGWRFESEVLEEDIEVTALGDAMVIQDELENSYQKM